MAVTGDDDGGQRSADPSFEAFLQTYQQREARLAELERFLTLVNKYDVLFHSPLPAAELAFALPRLCAALLRHQSRHSRGRLLSTIEAMGAAGEGALPTLIAVCRGFDERLSDQAARTIGELVAALRDHPARQQAVADAVQAAIEEAEAELGALPSLSEAVSASALPSGQQARLLSRLEGGDVGKIAREASEQLYRNRTAADSRALLLRLRGLSHHARCRDKLRQTRTSWEQRARGGWQNTTALRMTISDWGSEHADVLSEVCFYGSRQREDHRPDSDLDVAVVLRSVEGWDEARARWAAVQGPLREDLQRRVPHIVDLQLLFDAEHTPEVYRGTAGCPRWLLG